MPPKMPQFGMFSNLGQGYYQFEKMSPSYSKEDHDQKTIDLLLGKILSGKLNTKDIYTDDFEFHNIFTNGPCSDPEDGSPSMCDANIDNAEFLFDPQAVKIGRSIIDRDAHVQNTFLFTVNGKNNKSEVMARIPSPKNPNAATHPISLKLFAAIVSSYPKYLELDLRLKEVKKLRDDQRLFENQIHYNKLKKINNQSKRIHHEGKFKYKTTTICGQKVRMCYQDCTTKQTRAHYKNMMIWDQNLDPNAEYSEDSLSSDEESETKE